MKNTGIKGELIAATYLAGKGYEILFTNKRLKNSEIDIVARQGTKVIIAEVKTSSSNMIEPEDMMSRKKIKNLKTAALRLCASEKINSKQLRFDFIAIKIVDGKNEIKHYTDIV